MFIPQQFAKRMILPNFLAF